MTVDAITRKAGPYDYTSGAAYPFAFKVFAKTDVYVVVTENDIESIITRDTDYTVTLNDDQDNNPGGYVSLLTQYGSNCKVAIGSDVPYDQGMTLTNKGGFYPDQLNAAYDKLTVLAQQNREELSRCVKVNISSVEDPKNLLDNIHADSLAAIQSATNAAASAAAASQSETNAAVSETNAAASEAAALESRDAAAASAESAAVSSAAAQTARTGAEALYGDLDAVHAAAESASSSAAAAAASESAASASETAAATAEANAKASETAALTSETNAKASERNARTSETSAKTSETNAKSFWESAETSAQDALASKNAAATSASSAAASASATQTVHEEVKALYGDLAAIEVAVSNATTSAESAETARTAAAASASGAATSAAAALSSKETAEEAAVSAQASAERAETAKTGAETAYANAADLYGDLQSVHDAAASAAASATTATQKAGEATASATSAAASAQDAYNYAQQAATGQVNADWNATEGKAQILNKPALKTVATSGSYQDLTDKPTKVSAFENDAGYIDQTQLTSGLASKQDVLTYDTVPTAGSTNPVTSEGIKSAIDAKDSLPAQTGHTGKYLTTDGATASWADTGIDGKASKMEKTTIGEATPSLAVASGKAYVCSTAITSLTLTALPGADNYEESSIWFVAGDTAPTITIPSGVDYKTIGDLAPAANKAYVLSIMANTLILAEVEAGT